MSQANYVRAQTDDFDIEEEAFEINPSQELDINNTSEGDLGRATVLDSEDKVSEINSIEPDVIEASTDDEAKTKTAQEEKSNSNTQASSENADYSGDELVELRSNATIYLPYKLRQNPWGFSFSLGAEQANFPALISQFDDNTFEALFGSGGITMPVIEVGPKYNFSWGSLGLLFGYSSLSASDSRIGSESTLNIQRLSATATLYLDGLFSEAYIVPYVGAGIWQSEFSEESESFPGDVREYSTDPGYHMRVGALLGLDWIDLERMYRSRRETGITAMFLNVYASTSYMSESAPDPDLENEFDIGASLVFEF